MRRIIWPGSASAIVEQMDVKFRVLTAEVEEEHGQGRAARAICRPLRWRSPCRSRRIPRSSFGSGR